MLKIGLKQSDDFFVVGFDDANNPGVALLAGQVVTVTSADPSTVVIAQDASPRPTTADFTAGNGVVVPAGTVTQASGKVSAAQPPAQENVPVTVTSHIANADGSAVVDDTGAPIADISDTVEVIPALLKSEGILFGTPA
jgi:hypothetical protein